jgi:hypothetical protein
LVLRGYLMFSPEDIVIAVTNNETFRTTIVSDVWVFS